MSDYDLIIIGGGINGAGIARDASQRGLKVLMVEQEDFGSGTSNASTGFIHGGARYLLSDLSTTKASCIDSGIIQHIAPHLVFRIPLIYPQQGRWQGLLTESFFSAYDYFSRYRRAKPHCWLNAAELQQLLPGVPDRYTGAVTFDEWGVQAHRLVIANVLDAVAHGAEVLNHTEVLRLLIQEGTGRRVVTGVEIQNRLSGERHQIHANLICNATGPWSMDFAKRHHLNVPLRPAKGVHVVIPRRLLPFGVMTTAIDGRVIFFLPHGANTIIGTTDDDTFELPEQVVPTADDVAYLREGVAHVYPAINDEQPSMTYWGVRPTLYGRGQYEDDLSREHKIFDHAVTDHVEGIVSLAGGKLATYRIMAEETTDVIMRKLKRQGHCQTAELQLVGAEPIDVARACPRLSKIDPTLPQLLYHRYGSEIARMESMLEETPELARMLDAQSLLTEVELRYTARHEWVTTLADASRRTTWAENRRVDHQAVQAVTQVLADELGWDGEIQIYQMNRLFEAQDKATAALAGWHWRLEP